MSDITDTETLARAIFMADNSSAADPAAEWEGAGQRHRAYAYHIAEALSPLIEDSNRQTAKAYLRGVACELDQWYKAGADEPVTAHEAAAWIHAKADDAA